MTGTGIFGWLRPASSSARPAVTRATSPHLGQAAAPPSNQKQQPQKHATSVIIDTFLSPPPAARPGRWPRRVWPDDPRTPCDWACESSGDEAAEYGQIVADPNPVRGRF